MKKTSILLATLISTFILHAQDLNIAEGKSVTVAQGASININGLQLTPDTPFTINGANNVDRSATVITVGDISSISRVFSATNLVNNFTGILRFYYEDVDLNGIDETNLELQIEDNTGAWISYESILDNSSNIMTNVFDSPISFTEITATPNDGNLSIDDLGLTTIQLFPNPTKSKVNIDYANKIDVAIYNEFGQLLLRTRNKKIDMTLFNSGTYFFIITDQLNNKINSFKIIKQ